MQKRNILLLEPGYKNKYPPLGLMKLAQYHRRQNRRHNIVFAKGTDDPNLGLYKWDRIYITTLFSFEWKRTAACIDRAIELASKKKIFVGGIAASLMKEQFEEVDRWKGIHFISGILKDAPATSLKLGYHDFGRNDANTTPIDEMVPDYTILNNIEYQYPVYDAYFGYASRGCIRKCSFCGVPKLEGAQRDMPPITELVNSIDRLYGSKKDLVLMDNNVTAAPKFNEIMAEIRDLGFVPGARLRRNGSSRTRRVDFNQGVDSRLLCKFPQLMQQLSTICIDPLRIAFDHWGVRKQYEQSIRSATDHGISKLSNYMLYNFHDTPEDLYKRLRMNIELNQELGIRIWSFPMRYQPVTLKDRSFVGRNWNKYFLRSFQIILQATHGVVTGNPNFFDHAFGDTFEKFESLLWIPHQFIFSRNYFFRDAGAAILEEYMALFRRLTSAEKVELLCALVGEPSQKGLKPSKFKLLVTDRSISKNIRAILRFYAAYGYARNNIEDVGPTPLSEFYVPEEKRIEDAGLFDYFDEELSSLSFESITDVSPVIEDTPLRYSAGSGRILG